MFNIEFSNRVEALLDQLVLAMEQSLADPLVPEYVLVDNAVMGQWLNLQLAQRQGIASNIRYIQPHELFWTLARAVVSGDIPRQTPQSKEEMTWKLFSLLGDEPLLATAVMQPVQHYLQGDEFRSLKRYQLAAAVADLFDQYLIYRPEWMLEWEYPETWARKEDDGFHWQRALWVKLTESGPERLRTHLTPGLHHRAAIEAHLLTALDTQPGATLRQHIPLQRLFVFGITTMPPRLLDMLMLLGKHLDVQMCTLNPCQEYWFDIASARSLVKKSGKRERGDGVIGNPLLASQGQQVREFIESIYKNMDRFPFSDNEHYVAPGGETLLRCIQQEILEMRYCGDVATLAGQGSGEKQAVPLEGQAGSVNSVQIHSCHSPLREVEVLHDQLLALFTQDPTLKPRDVVVMMPQVAPYVPYIDTVFGARPRELPYHITDRSWLEEVPLLNVLELLLGLPDSRLPLTEILALLEVPAVQARFGLDREGFEKLKQWLRDSGARWGMDAAHREQQGLPAYSEFSWEFGINRMLAGYAMAADAPLAMSGSDVPVLPYDEIEGGGALLLDGFLQCWDKLMAYRTALQQAVGLEGWADRLADLLDDFIDPQTDDERLALREIRRQVGVLRKAGQWFRGPVELSVIRAALQPALQAPAQGGHPWREGIKFCSLLPMRGVPFRVVYMLGMNQSDYPKRNAQPGFDLMRQHYQPGDRSRRVDDRWLFLEALLSARDVFHVSYVGRDQRKNEERQPSVVVAELIDYLRHGYVLDEASLIVEHPLQPFSRACFVEGRDPRLASFNAQAFAIAAHKQTATRATVSDCWPQSAEADGIVEVSLDSFVRFFTDPPQWFFRDRHQRVSLKVEHESVSDSEVFELAAGLEGWALKDALRELAEVIAPDPAADDEQRVATVFDVLEARWQAEGKWPLGSGGASLREKIAKELKVSWLDARRSIEGSPVSVSACYELRTDHGILKISGDLACIGETLFFHSASNSSDKHKLRFALQAAFAGLAVPEQVKSAVAVFWGDTRIAVEDIAQRNNAQLLNTMAGFYLQYREQGLPFEPGLSLGFKPEYETDRQKWQKTVDDAWEGDRNSKGIADDIQAVAYYMNRNRLLAETFIETAKQIKAAVKAWEAGEVNA